MPSGTKPSVLVIGGGPGGVSVARQLFNVADVTVVDPSPYFEVHWGCLRAVVEPALADRMLVPYESIPRLGTFVNGKVAELGEKSAKLSDGTVLDFDYAVVCTGSGYGDAVVKARQASLAERKATIQDAYARIVAAKSVLIVGGGPVGVELAAEILTDFPGQKTVTLVTSQDTLLAGNAPRLGTKAKQWLESRGCKLILGERVSKGPPFTLENSGETLAADVVFWCTGTKKTTEYMVANFQNMLDDSGLVKVDEFLRVEGKEHIFAVGDCNNVKETKLGYLAMAQGAAVAKSIQAIIKKGSGQPKLQKWVPGKGIDLMVVTFGRKMAYMQVKGIVFGGFLPTKLKCKDVFVGKTRKDIGMQA
ncbi:unnamed protein product [Ostreobium quekettii]|uniref:FAD/NAD(P)-binding domain-containing protein n=1 Tax=Ostreobium quekettii TaxID=121088 RepID=A0A8S1JBT4_9CHLO|nr:unnamed protein product [Ostreobium quekettii]|eukprot:evm.model.scf_2743.2 EVM.evm.TU.scf_2743.2   scf_2743:15885-18048(+)